MRNLCLTVKVLESFLFQYNKQSTSRSQNYTRISVSARAAPLSTWQDIVSEFYSKKHENELLSHTAFIEDRYLVVMSVKTFVMNAFYYDFLNGDFNYNLKKHSNPEPEIIELAKSLVAQRDYKDAGGYLKNPHLSLRHFWPKD